MATINTNSAASYLSDSLSPSFQKSLGESLLQQGAGSATSAQGALEEALQGGANSLPLGDAVSDYLNAPEFGVDVTGDLNGVAEALSGTGALAQTAWTFITAPEDVSWDIANQASRIDMFGTNNPPVVAGARGMRDLTLSNSLVEGFIRNVTVEAKVAALEKLMEYGLNASDGFVSVPVYQVWANKKSYGGPAGYFIIRDVKVKETMRDLTGNTTRAYVDVSLMQVPEYQVNSGRDQASATTSGAKSGLLSQAQVNAAQAAQGAGSQNAAANSANQGVGTPANPAAGPGAGGNATTAKPGNAGSRGSSTGDASGNFGRLAQPLFP